MAVRAERFVSAQPRVWKDAPGAVIVAFGLAWVALILSTLVLFVSAILLACGTDSAADIVSVSASLLAGALWLIHSHRTGRPIAWWLQMALSIVCLLGFPYLTVLHGLLLCFWYRADVRHWYAAPTRQ